MERLHFIGSSRFFNFFSADDLCIFSYGIKITDSIIGVINGIRGQATVSWFIVSILLLRE